MQTYGVEVTVSKQEDGLWRAEVPALPGCFVDSETLEEAITDIQEGIRLFIASYRRHGEPLPPGLDTIGESDLPQSLRILVSVS
ncbi:MAG: type II toxin-antitoxin system HicB family antitoxin [Chloroflexi bacterium]|nr:type II toxin-antitoxin system HicB family antitoxin [Chloroflexota bacterium]